MKATIGYVLDSYISKNEKYIKEMNLNVVDFIISDTEAMDDGWIWYLTDEEIIDYKNSSLKRNNMIKEIRDYISQNYNYKL